MPEEPYEGAEEANEYNVTRYLTENYLNHDGGPLDPMQARLMIAGGEHLQRGRAQRSYAYYVGDQIAKELELKPIPTGEADRD